MSALTPSAAETRCFLAAFDGSEPQGQGFVFPAELTARQAPAAQFSAKGQMGSALLPILKRVVQLLVRLDSCWRPLTQLAWKLESQAPGYYPAQTNSAGLGLAIGVFSIARQLNGSTAPSTVSGTGLVRFNGTIEPVKGETAKTQAVAQQLGSEYTLLTAQQIPHLSHLQGRILRYMESGS